MNIIIGCIVIARYNPGRLSQEEIPVLLIFKFY